MVFGDAYIAAQIKALGGRPIIVSGQTTLGLIDVSDEEILPGESASGVGKRTEVTVKTGSLSALAVGVAVKVDGDDMVVRQVRQIEDGRLTTFRCSA